MGPHIESGSCACTYDKTHKLLTGRPAKALGARCVRRKSYFCGFWSDWDVLGLVGKLCQNCISKVSFSEWTSYAKSRAKRHQRREVASFAYYGIPVHLDWLRPAPSLSVPKARYFLIRRIFFASRTWSRARLGMAEQTGKRDLSSLRASYSKSSKDVHSENCTLL